MLAVLGAAPVLAAEARPDAAEILRRVAEADTEEAREAAEAYSYSRATMVLIFDDEGKVEKQTERLYKVFPEEGEPVMRLISVNGEPAEADDERDGGKYRETGEKAKRLEIDAELLARYEFTFERFEVIEGRRAALLSFRPKAEPPDSGGIFGKLLNALAGRIWVDAEESQIARLEVTLVEKVNFFGGLAGAIEELDLMLARERVAPGVWMNRNTRIDLTGRKFLSSLRMRAFENCVGFTREREVARRPPPRGHP